MTKLTTVLGEYPHVRPLLSGDVPLAGYAIEAIEVRPIISAYRRMIQALEFDICELAPVTYLMALQAGLAITAIPVFLNRRFHHGDVQCAAGSGIAVPADLEGRRVGVRAYTVSTGVWVRGVLSEDYGVDIDAITWVVDDDDHIDGRTPGNVERVTDGRSLGELLRLAEIDAALTGNAGTGRAGAPRPGWAAAAPSTPPPSADDQAMRPYPLFEHADIIARDWYLRTGIYPLHSVIALRAELVERDPDLPTALYAAFAESKRRHLAADPQWATFPPLAQQSALIAGDPIPYGPRSNDVSVTALVRFARAQGLLDGLPGGRIFAAGDYPES